MERKASFYEKYIKRLLDLVLSFLAITFLSPVMFVTAVLVRVKLGSPVIFKQQRPGKDGKIFSMYKFRTMTDARDSDGNLLPDEERLTKFGKRLRSTSLDELPELINILKGDMSIVGPRPQLVRDMVFMTTEQNQRHKVKQGLTGWAQVNGRNGISWEDKLKYDVEYVENMSFMFDVKILLMTVISVLNKEGITMEDMETAMDLGDYLLQQGKVDRTKYEHQQSIAKNILSGGE